MGRSVKSILQHSRYCLICKTEQCLEEHHVFEGIWRKASEKYGLKVYLCPKDHRGNNGVHFNTSLDLLLKKSSSTAI